jgi:hypothetical protein
MGVVSARSGWRTVRMLVGDVQVAFRSPRFTIVYIYRTDGAMLPFT